VYWKLFVPALIPLTFQEYAGVVPPLTEVAVKVIDDPWQTGLAEALTETEAGRNGLTVIVILLDEAGLPVAQRAFEVNIHNTMSPFTGAYVYWALFVPAGAPLTFHWKEGVLPPLTGMAVKVTAVPAHTGLADALTVTETGRVGLTAMEIVLDVAGLPRGQG